MQGKSLPQDVYASGGEQQSLAFALPPVMTIETAEALAAELKQLPLEGKTTLMLDASMVETITTPGLQLIVSLAKALELQGGVLVISGQKDSFIHAFEDAGLENLLKQSL